MLSFRRQRLDDEAKAEMEAHVDLLAERYRQQGLSPEDARAAARRQFGNLTWHREEVDAMNGRRWLDELTRDIAYGVRQVRRGPGFAAVVVATLALGIGGTTAVFSVMHSLLLAPLPYSEPGRLARLYQEEPAGPSTRRGFSAPQFRMLREQATSFGVGARYYREDLGLDLTHGGSPQRLRVLLVTADYFKALAPEGVRGPGFTLDDERREVRRDDRTGGARVILSNELWRARFNGEAEIVGTSIRLSGEPREVAGIAPPGFEDPVAGSIDAWLPYDLAADTFEENNSVVAFARLRNGVGMSEAAVELGVLSGVAKQRWPAASASHLVAVPLQDDVTRASRPLLRLLLMAVGLVLIVACANVANLMLVRATGRVQEFAIRASLGSGRRRLVRQLIVESIVLSVLGGAAGLGLAMLGVDFLQTAGREALPRLRDVTLDPMVLGFAAAITIATALFSAAVPAVRLSAIDPSRVLTSKTRSTGTRRQQRMRNGLAAAQLGLALALLSGAGVLSMRLYALMRIDPGFRVEGVFTFDINLPDARHDDARRAAFQEELAARLTEIPGVIAAGGTSRLPGAGSFHTWPALILTGPRAGTSVTRLEQPEHRTVSGDFFGAMGIQLLAGRTFDGRDHAKAPMRAVVSANFAALAFPGLPLDQVIGQRVAILGRRNVREIIGVVSDVAVDPQGERRSTVYSGHRQFAGNRNWMLTQAIATHGAPDALLPAIRKIVSAMDPELVVHRPMTMSAVLARGASPERFALLLIGVFAVVSLGLAAVGLYGVLAAAVRQRTPEIGIRIALGAAPRDVRSLVIRQAVGVLGVGVIVGLAGAFAMEQWISSIVFQAGTADPRILATSTLVLLVIGACAAWLPARRASRVTPRSVMVGDDA